MTNITTQLLDFLMDLLKSPDAGAAFAADPESALDKAGLQGVCAADVDAVLPVALDFSPVGNREYDTGGNSIGGNATSGITGGSASNAAGGAGGGGGGSAWAGGGGGGGGGGHHAKGGHDDHDVAVEKLLSVVNNYSYIDDRDVVNDQSVNQTFDILALDGDVEIDQEFNQESTTIGDGNVVAGGNVAIGNTDVDVDLEIEDSFNTETDVDIEDSFNDNSDNSTNVLVNDSFNEDNSTNVEIEDSFQDNSVEIEDSFQDNSTEVDIEDSFNEDNSTDVDVDIEDSFQDNSVNDSLNDNEIGNTNVEDNNVNVDSVVDSLNDNEVGNTDVDVEVEDSFNDESVEIEDNIVVEDSFQANENEVGNTDVDVDVEDSFQANDNFSDNFSDNEVLSDNVTAVDDSIAAG